MDNFNLTPEQRKKKMLAEAILKTSEQNQPTEAYGAIAKIGGQLLGSYLAGKTSEDEMRVDNNRAKAYADYLSGNKDISGIAQFDPKFAAEQKSESMRMDMRSQERADDMSFKREMMKEERAIRKEDRELAREIKLRDIESEREFKKAQDEQDKQFRREESAKNRDAITSRASNKPLTEGQSNAATFYERLKRSGEDINNLEKAGTSVLQEGLSNIPVVGNSLISDERQVLDQSKRDFINAVLRRESGANITTSEFENAEQQYLPRVGDSQAVIEKKRINRDIVTKTYNAENAIYNYHWFQERAGGIKATEASIQNAIDAKASFESSAGPRKDWGFEDKNEDARLGAVVLGLKNQYQSLVTEYNAKAGEVDRAIFVDGLPLFFSLNAY